MSFRTSSESTDTFTLDTWTGQPLLNLFVASVPVPANVAALLRTMHPREGAGLPVGYQLIDDQRPIARLRVSGRVTPARERFVQALVRLRISSVARGSLPRRRVYRAASASLAATLLLAESPLRELDW